MLRCASGQVNHEFSIRGQGGFTVANGAFSGVVWGALVAVMGAGGLSLAYPDYKPGGFSDAMQEAVAEELAATEEVAETVVSETPAMDVDETNQLEAAPEELVEDLLEDVALEQEPEAPMADVVVEDEVFDPETGEPEVETAKVAETKQAEPDTVVADAVEAEPAVELEVSEAETPIVETEIEPETAAEETVENADAAESITDEIITSLPKPVGTVGDLAPEVTTNRLPSLATDQAETEDSPSAVTPPPFERFASTAPIENDKPRMSIVLIDMGDSSLGVEALDTFPYPLTFAVDASTPNAVERMQVYRDKGFEVLALVDLPRGATASDVEVAMSVYLAAVPEAVGILEGVETGVQTSREMADQLTKIVLDSGHGMLLQKSGLNTARKLAEREGIPAATVFRDFDGNGQSASVMRRFLDQAAFRAAQEGGVVMMGRLQAETISALLIWGFADRASRVGLVPVSAVLKQDAPDEG